MFLSLEIQPPHLVLYASSLSVQQVHMGGEWNIFKVIEEVCDGHSREDHVDGVPHVPVGEHQDVGEVEQGAQHAHQHCHQPAVVDWKIKALKMRYGW